MARLRTATLVLERRLSNCATSSKLSTSGSRAVRAIKIRGIAGLRSACNVPDANRNRRSDFSAHEAWLADGTELSRNTSLT